jgi:hypothetical protein
MNVVKNILRPSRKCFAPFSITGDYFSIRITNPSALSSPYPLLDNVLEGDLDGGEQARYTGKVRWPGIPGGSLPSNADQFCSE